MGSYLTDGLLASGGAGPRTQSPGQLIRELKDTINREYKDEFELSPKSSKALRKADVLGWETRTVSTHWLAPLSLHTREATLEQQLTMQHQLAPTYGPGQCSPKDLSAIRATRMIQNLGRTAIYSDSPYVNNALESLVTSYKGTEVLQPRRTAGRVPRVGSRAAAMNRAKRALSQVTAFRPEVPFADAVRVATVHNDRTALPALIETYILSRPRQSGAMLEQHCNVLAAQAPTVQLQAAALLVQQGFYFAAIKVVYHDAELLSATLQEISLILTQDLGGQQGQAAAWNWKEADKELFQQQFSRLRIIHYYRELRGQLQLLRGKGTAALAHVEREMLHKVVNDFRAQLSAGMHAAALAATEAAAAAAAAAEVSSPYAPAGKPARQRVTRPRVPDPQPALKQGPVASTEPCSSPDSAAAGLAARAHAAKPAAAAAPAAADAKEAAKAHKPRESSKRTKAEPARTGKPAKAGAPKHAPAAPAPKAASPVPAEPSLASLPGVELSLAPMMADEPSGSPQPQVPPAVMEEVVEESAEAVPSVPAEQPADLRGSLPGGEAQASAAAQQQEATQGAEVTEPAPEQPAELEGAEAHEKAASPDAAPSAAAAAEQEPGEAAADDVSAAADGAPSQEPVPAEAAGPDAAAPGPPAEPAASTTPEEPAEPAASAAPELPTEPAAAAAPEESTTPAAAAAANADADVSADAAAPGAPAAGGEVLQKSPTQGSLQSGSAKHPSAAPSRQTSSVKGQPTASQSTPSEAEPAQECSASRQSSTARREPAQTSSAAPSRQTSSMKAAPADQPASPAGSVRGSGGGAKPSSKPASRQPSRQPSQQGSTRATPTAAGAAGAEPAAAAQTLDAVPEAPDAEALRAALDQGLADLKRAGSVARQEAAAAAAAAGSRLSTPTSTTITQSGTGSLGGGIEVNAMFDEAGAADFDAQRAKLAAEMMEEQQRALEQRVVQKQADVAALEAAREQLQSARTARTPTPPRPLTPQEQQAAAVMDERLSAVEARLRAEREALARLEEEKRKHEEEKKTLSEQLSKTMKMFQDQLSQTIKMAALLQAQHIMTGGPVTEPPQLPQMPLPQEVDEPPTAEEIQEYGRYLGMDVDADGDLLYIAEWALTAPVPEGWTVHLDAQGNEFFYNAAANKSSYEHPMDQHYKEYYIMKKMEKQQKAAGGPKVKPIRV